MSPESIRHVLDRAIRIARAQRAPTCVIVPNDLQEMEAVAKPPRKHGTVHSGTGYSAPLPRCAYPYQVTAPAGVTERSGPGVGDSAVGTSPGGALAWVTCQRSGSTVGTTRIWDRLDNGHYVSDHYVATPSSTSYSKPVPRC